MSNLFAIHSVLIANSGMHVALTQNDVRLSLAEEEAAGIEADNSIGVHDEISPAILIQSGMDLEEHQ